MMKFEKENKYLCMLAPSFVVDFEYPDIVYRLRALGFDKVVELTFGAKMTNIFYYELLKEHSDRTWIASPCPTIVNLVRTQYPNLVKNLVPVHSPMGSMGLICKKFFPDYKIVFVGPCISKKLESKELGYIDEALTFKELEDLFSENGIPENITDEKCMITFDKFYNDYTKIYPISGGLSSTLHYKSILKKNEILVTDGLKNVKEILDSFKGGYYKKYKFIDMLNCEGGCINGPGIIGKCNIKDRKKKILKYKDYSVRYEQDLGRNGKRIDAEGIDFKREFE